MSLEEWEPRTRLGTMVLEGEITTIDEIFQRGLRIQEVEIVDTLLPGMAEEVVDINLVQAMSSAGRKRKFQATMIVGDKNGHIGIAQSKLREIGPAIRHAITLAKMNIAPVRRGCGSWECRCGGIHSVPFKTNGRTGSVRIEIMPAPRGTGLAAGNIAKTVLDLAGIEDAWTKTGGDTRTTANFAKATFEALKSTYSVLPPAEWQR
ncbi:MAG: 30S ribosomal protein S5 [Candidatus Kariarchaeaceae archaeon]